jgi:hypothetical protein
MGYPHFLSDILPGKKSYDPTELVKVRPEYLRIESKNAVRILEFFTKGRQWSPGTGSEHIGIG